LISKATLFEVPAEESMSLENKIGYLQTGDGYISLHNGLSIRIAGGAIANFIFNDELDGNKLTKEVLRKLKANRLKYL